MLQCTYLSIKEGWQETAIFCDISGKIAFNAANGLALAGKQILGV
jgi:hypothetical protein